MKLTEFKRHLRASPNHELQFLLPNGRLIEPHAHITEVGRVEKTFIDCGGTIRRTASCALQSWVADDIDHRLPPGRLAGIIDNAASILGDEDVDVEIEYQDQLLSQFPIASVETTSDLLCFRLTTKHTDCLAKDVCLPPVAEAGTCCTASGCC